jgi:hypothetical protein
VGAAFSLVFDGRLAGIDKPWQRVFEGTNKREGELKAAALVALLEEVTPDPAS